MKNRNMLFLLVLFALAMIVWVLAFTGCETQNPICTENYCITGEIFAKDDLAENQAFDALPGTVSEDDLLAIFRGDAPVVNTENEATLQDILSDVRLGNKTYLNKVVTVTGIVAWRNTDGRSLVISEDGSVLVAIPFFITSFEDASLLNSYRVGGSYTFTVMITQIQPSKSDPTKTNIFAKIIVK